jgi:hypothetical protein
MEVWPAAAVEGIRPEAGALVRAAHKLMGDPDRV